MSLEQTYNVEEVAEIEHMPASSIRAMCADGAFPGAYKSGQRACGAWRIPESAIVKYRQNRANLDAPPLAALPRRRTPRRRKTA